MYLLLLSNLRHFIMDDISAQAMLGRVAFFTRHRRKGAVDQYLPNSVHYLCANYNEIAINGTSAKSCDILDMDPRPLF